MLSDHLDQNHNMRVTMPARELLESLPDGAGGLLVTDPPWKLHGGGRFAAVADYPQLSVKEVADVLSEARRVLEPGAHAYVFAPAGAELADVFKEMGKRKWRFVRELSWHKGHHRALGAFRNGHEPFLIFANGKPRPFEQSMKFSSVIKADPGPRTTKPWIAYKIAVEMSSRPGALVIDPFCGTNPLAHAIAHLREPRRWISGDILPPEEIARSIDAGSSWKQSGGLGGSSSCPRWRPAAEPGSYAAHVGPSLARFEEGP